MKALNKIAFVLIIIGGLNWGLVGIGVGDVVAYLGSVIATIVYILVGLSALMLIFTGKKMCKCQNEPAAPAQM